jgi:hypothetical protein
MMTIIHYIYVVYQPLYICEVTFRSSDGRPSPLASEIRGGARGVLVRYANWRVDERGCG